jgi:hypothetical protein
LEEEQEIRDIYEKKGFKGGDFMAIDNKCGKIGMIEKKIGQDEGDRCIRWAKGCANRALGGCLLYEVQCRFGTHGSV